MSRLLAACVCLLMSGAAGQHARAAAGAAQPSRPPVSSAADLTRNPTMTYGACCLAEVGCVSRVKRDHCRDDKAGHFLGVGTSCSEDECPDCDCNGLTDITEITRCVNECVKAGGDRAQCAVDCDADNDGIPNVCQDGSIDPDGDGTAGDCDGCPDDPQKIDPGICGCGQVDVDSDNDGIYDCNDACPNDPGNDADGDGVCDRCETDEECDDGNLCTYDDKCKGGFCFFKPLLCDFPATCDPKTGKCDGCSNSPDECSDAEFCNGLEVLDAEACVCDPGTDPCTDPARLHCDELKDECVECLIDEHCDDGDACTIDNCVDEVCDISPVECPKDQGCDPADGVCRFCADTPAGMCCNPADGLMIPIDDGNSCTEDLCVSGGKVQHVAFALPPLAQGVGPRSITVTAQPSDSTREVALHLSSPNFPCLSRYLDADGTIVDEPVFQPLADWGTVTVTRQDIVPSATGTPTIYEVRTVCDPLGKNNTGPTQAIPYVWGDVNNDQIVDSFDIFCVLDGFQGLFENCSFVSVNLTPCIPDSLMDLFDILSVLDAFSGEPFPCASPCGGGACCQPDSTLCLQLPEAECDSRDWLYQGDGTHCRFNPCHP